MCDWVARVYVNALNIIHYMHDKYAYEKLEMALHDKDVNPTGEVKKPHYHVICYYENSTTYNNVKT